MDSQRKARLEADGWKFGDIDELLGLSPEEMEIVEIRAALSRHLHECRASSEPPLKQTELAERMGSSQSRIAKAEKNNPAISVDLMLRALVYAGVSREEIGRVIAGEL